MRDKVTTLTELLTHGFQAPTLTQAVKLFTNAYWLNKAYEESDKELILEEQAKAFLKLQKQPTLEGFTDDELKSLYPNKELNLETLSPSDLAVKRLKRELNC